MKGLHPVSTRGTGTDCCIQTCGPRLTTGTLIPQMHAKKLFASFFKCMSWKQNQLQQLADFRARIPASLIFSSRFWSEKISEKTCDVTPIEADRKRAAQVMPLCSCAAVARSENGGKVCLVNLGGAKRWRKVFHIGQPAPTEVFIDSEMREGKHLQDNKVRKIEGKYKQIQYIFIRQKHPQTIIHINNVHSFLLMSNRCCAPRCISLLGLNGLGHVLWDRLVLLKLHASVVGQTPF